MLIKKYNKWPEAQIKILLMSFDFNTNNINELQTKLISILS